MIRLTRLDGHELVVNERNIQWVESLPDTSVVMLGGARILVRESVEEVARAVRAETSLAPEADAARSVRFDAAPRIGD